MKQRARESEEERDAEMMSIESIYPNPNSRERSSTRRRSMIMPRSIRQYGVLEPLLVTPRGDRYMIIAGERRYRASLLAGLTEVPAITKEADDALVEELALLENVQRQDLNIMEEARAYGKLLEKGYSVEDLSQRLCKAVRFIEQRASLLRLDASFQKFAATGELNASEAYELSRVPAHRQAEVCRRILSGELRSYLINKIRSFVNGLLKIEQQESLLSFELASVEERKSMQDFETALGSVERFLKTVSDGRIGHLKKAVFHSSVTPERLDVVIASLTKIRRAVVEGAGIKTAMEG
jgi:ParB/RepB/Spo0J family partition protein